MRVSVKDPSTKVNHLSKVIKDYNRVYKVYQFYQNKLASPYVGH